MSKIIAISTIFGSHAFFVILAIVGYKYDGVEESKIYLSYTLTLALASLLLFLCDVIRKKRRIKITLFIAPTVVVQFYLLTILFGEVSTEATNFFIYFLIWSLPSFLIGAYFAWDHRYEYLFKSLDLVMLLGAFATIISTVVNVLQGHYAQGLAGGTNQSLSYIAALIFGLNLFLNFVPSQIKRFNFTRTYFYRVISIILLPALLLAVIIAGGRGGMVLIIVYTLLFFVKLVRNFHGVRSGLLVFSVIVALCFVNVFLNNEIVNSGFNRAFSYIGENSINWGGTSNRDNVYMQAIELIKDRPLFGYGMFGYLSHFSNPHNLILEIMLSGGIFYLVIFSFISILIIKKFIRVIRFNKNMELVGIIALLPITMLMFSGTYLVSSELWFFLGFVLSLELNEAIKKKF